MAISGEKVDLIQSGKADVRAHLRNRLARPKKRGFAAPGRDFSRQAAMDSEVSSFGPTRDGDRFKNVPTSAGRVDYRLTNLAQVSPNQEAPGHDDTFEEFA